MATLQQPGTGCVFELLPDTLVGRSARCQMQLHHESVSQVHASLRFLNNSWQIQDRNSTNGTWIDGECMMIGETRRLLVGCALRFGSSETWNLIDDSAPQPRIRQLPAGPALQLGAEPLSLPGSEGAEVRWDGAHAILRQLGRADRLLSDGQEFEVGGKTYRAHLPSALATAAFERHLSQTELRILPDSSLELRVRGKTHRLAARAPYVVVRELARERLRDRSRGCLPEEEGWLDRQLLADRLRRPDLNQDIRRIREDFRKLQLFEAAEDVIETHRDQGKVRLGVARLQLEE
jgi:hypothetical protein